MIREIIKELQHLRSLDDNRSGSEADKQPFGIGLVPRCDNAEIRKAPAASVAGPESHDRRSGFLPAVWLPV
jgi:hypothetical protein